MQYGNISSRKNIILVIVYLWAHKTELQQPTLFQVTISSLKCILTYLNKHVIFFIYSANILQLWCISAFGINVRHIHTYNAGLRALWPSELL